MNHDRSLTFRLLFADNVKRWSLRTLVALTRRQKQVYDFSLDL